MGPRAPTLAGLRYGIENKHQHTMRLRRSTVSLSIKMTDFIDLTLDDEQSGDSFGLPASPASEVNAIQQAADFGELSDLDLPLVKSEPVDASGSGCVVIVSEDSLSDLRYDTNPCIDAI